MIISEIKSNMLPNPGQIVRVRTRTYLVEALEGDRRSPDSVVSLACLDDDAQGEKARRCLGN